MLLEHYISTVSRYSSTVTHSAQIQIFTYSSFIPEYLLKYFRFSTLLKGTMVEHHLGIKPTTFELQAQVPNNYTTLLPCQTDYIFF
uniref:Uncharacterized protein n=1 Tax=Anguilla anguilla TaxID=7936 RepID=A0A0E9WXZ3_ANGAN